MIQDIPKLYTALAEWLACVLLVDRHCSAKPLDSRHDRGFGFDVRYNLVVLPLELL